MIQDRPEKGLKRKGLCFDTNNLNIINIIYIYIYIYIYILLFLFGGVLSSHPGT